MPELRNRPAQPDVPSEPYPRDVPAPPADLRQRLDRLPPGHPSSPRNADLGGSNEALEGGRAPGRDRDALLDDEPDHDEAAREPDAVRRGYWSEVPRFLAAWADHLRNWPADRAAAAVDRSRDPAGSWRGDGNQYLSPEQHAQAKDVITGVQRAEKTLTGHMEAAERDNTCGGWLAGKEFRLKGEERLKEKIADISETSAPDAAPQEIMHAIPDAIRYTFCAESQDYVDAYWNVKERLQDSGHTMHYSENHWLGTQYKGINTRWATLDGQQFEVQFHTPESFHAKQQITHVSYERLRSSVTTPDERRELMSFQQDVCSWIPVPEGAADIPNHREEGR